MGAFTFVILLGSLRTNLALALTFAMLCPTFLIFGASRIHGAAGTVEKLHSLERVSLSFSFNLVRIWTPPLLNIVIKCLSDK